MNLKYIILNFINNLIGSGFMSEKIILVLMMIVIFLAVCVSSFKRAEGWEVETYSDSEKGLIALQRNSPDMAVRY